MLQKSCEINLPGSRRLIAPLPRRLGHSIGSLASAEFPDCLEADINCNPAFSVSARSDRSLRIMRRLAQGILLSVETAHSLCQSRRSNYSAASDETKSPVSVISHGTAQALEGVRDVLMYGDDSLTPPACFLRCMPRQIPRRPRPRPVAGTSKSGLRGCRFGAVCTRCAPVLFDPA